MQRTFIFNHLFSTNINNYDIYYSRCYYSHKKIHFISNFSSTKKRHHRINTDNTHHRDMGMVTDKEEIYLKSWNLYRWIAGKEASIDWKGLLMEEMKSYHQQYQRFFMIGNQLVKFQKKLKTHPRIKKKNMWMKSKHNCSHCKQNTSQIQKKNTVKKPHKFTNSNANSQILN